MSHAWLIIAHNEFGILQRLISMLDAHECDIFIHIDKKVKSLPRLVVSYSKLFILDNRIDVRWGHISQIETELLLMETAMRQGQYSHYHIISGTHLPLKPLEVILNFYDSHPDEEIMRFWSSENGESDFKLRRFHFPIRNFRSSDKLSRPFYQFVWRCVLKVQIILGIKHLKEEHFYKTDNWLSLTEEAVRYIVSRKKAIIRKYRWSLCGDEYFVATELKAAGAHFRIMDYQKLLFVNFKSDCPCSFLLTELPELSKTDYLFARKFREN